MVYSGYDSSAILGLIRKVVTLRRQSRKTLLHSLLCLLVLLTIGRISHAVPKASRAVSLNALANAVRTGSSADEARRLCGITRLRGYITDAKSNDVILLGIVDPDMPSLNLDDLVVAMRNTWGKYDRIIGRTRHRSDPGCSIDPNPAVLAQLRDFERATPSSISPEAMQERMEKWKIIGKQPQKVRILGVPFDCRFAKVMVDADYYMKRIVNGSVDLGIDGLVSLSDLDIELRRKALRTGSKIENGSMSRFWFSPGDSTYEVRDGATILRSCEVKLLTEAEYLNDQGVVVQAGHADPCADRFARSFSQKYDEIAAQRPIYKELKALFSFVAISRLMKDDRIERTASRSLGYLLNNYKINTVPVSRAVNGLTDVRAISETVDTAEGKKQFCLTQSCCGGVSMGVKPRRIKTHTPMVATPTASAKPASASAGSTRPPTSRATTGAAGTQVPAKKSTATAPKTGSIKSVVLGARKSASAMSWDVPVQLD